MGLALRDSGYHTYADYLTWPEDVRHKLIGGAGEYEFETRFFLIRKATAEPIGCQ